MSYPSSQRPSSHPVVRRQAVIDTIRAAATRPLSPVAATRVAEFNDRLDEIAALTMHLPHQPLTEVQRERLRIITRELLFRAQV